MNTLTEFSTRELARLDATLLSQALLALQELTDAADADLYSEAPECQSGLNRLQDALQQAYAALMSIQEALGPEDTEQAESRANRILDEAEEAFAARSLGEERALCGEWLRPATVSDYLFWIEDEARIQQAYRPDDPEQAAEQRFYLEALQELALELHRLGFSPSPPPWEAAADRSIAAGGAP
jgi:hypothetical protein